jgi:gliding motility-associated-like protein
MKKFIFPFFIFVALVGFVRAQGVWTQKANFGGVARYGAVGFSIGAKGYIGTGRDAIGNYLQDFWEWDQATNVWTQKANFGGGTRYLATGFSIGTKGYMGTGLNSSTYPTDFWEWDQASNIWTQKANFGGGGTMIAVGFSIGNKGYIGTGSNPPNGLTSNFWEWDQVSNVWTQKANFGGAGRYEAAGFSIGSQCYIGTGYANSGVTSDFWEWDQATNVWTQKANFPGTAREGAAGFAIGSYGFIGIGFAHDAAPYYKDFYQYDPSNNTWTQQTNFSGTGRDIAVGFSIGCKGYIGTGQNPTELQDFWEFTPTNGSITANVSSSSVAICYGENATLTASGGITYSWSNSATTSSIIVTPSATSTYSVSVSNGFCSDDTSITITVNSLPVAVISGNAHICAGQNVSLTASGGGNYLWNTGATSNSISVSPSTTTNYSVTVTSANGCADTANANIIVTPTPIATISPNSTICAGNVVTLTANGGANYSWSTGETNSSIQVTPNTSTTYSVFVANGSCIDTASVSLFVNPNPTATTSGSITIFQGQSTTLIASGGGGYLWSNGETTTAITVMPTVTTIYCVTVTDTNNCKDASCATVIIESPCDTAGAFFFPNAFSPNNDGENDVLKIYYGNMDCIKSLQLLIYDRWGEQVYETIDPNFSWDGTYQNKTLITQVLAYHLSVGFTDGNAINRKGNISLVR